MQATVNAFELSQLCENGSVSLIDVLLPEDFADRHISGAINACVYEMAFLERMAECVPDRDTCVVVYDHSGTTLTATMAKMKLTCAGYRNVAVLEGGLLAWQAAGGAIVGALTPEIEAESDDGTYVVDIRKSVVEWSGCNINNRHHGRINIADGEVLIEDGLPKSGRFVIDMKSITNADLKDESWRNMLLQHLKSADFFDVERYPTATFELCEATAITACTPGMPNREISGVITIKDASHTIRFPAIVVAQGQEGFKAQASFNFDRTMWNVSYGSGKLFERLGMHLVHDLVSVDLFIVTRRPAIAAC